jgi:hypothetical protein
MKKIPGTLLTSLVVILAGTVVSGYAQDAAKPAAPANQGKAPKDNPLLLSSDAPTMYTVVKGDTLWDISGRFLKEPWRWPEIWNMNRDQIKNPHLIYPGDIVKLSFDASGKPLLTIVPADAGVTSKLSPRIRAEAIDQAIPSIPARVIGPFLTAPLVAEEGAMNSAPRIIASEDSRVVVGAGNLIYAVGLKPDQGTKWQIYRPGKALIDPATKEVLGYEAQFLGDAKVNRFGEGLATPTTLEVVKSNQEINRGDRLMSAGNATLPQYSPRAPEEQVKGSVISVVGGVSETAQYSVVVLNLGKRESMEVGHVLSVQTGGQVVSTNTSEEGTHGWSIKSLLPASWRTGPDGVPPEVTLPTERNGLLVVFRVFDRVSYALVMSSKRPLKIGDTVQTP